MKVYVFGNRDYEKDKLSFDVVDKIDLKKLEIEFVEVKPNQDLPFAGSEIVVMMDVVMGIDEVKLITQDDLDKLVLPPRSSAHDYDLGFQLKYLLKLGKLKRIRIIGLPMSGKVDYDSIHSILRKLVAQDIQGS